MNNQIQELMMAILEEIIRLFVPIASLGISIIALHKTRRVRKIEDKLREYDLFIKEYEVEKIKRETRDEQRKKEEECKADVKARIYRISSDRYRIKVYNTGKGIAYNVNYDISKEYQIILHKNIVPFEILNPGCNFEEPVTIYNGSSRKYKVNIFWEDADGNKYSNEVLESY